MTVAEEGEGEGEKEKEGKEGEKVGEDAKEKPEGEKEDDPCTRPEGVVRFVVTDPTNMESRLSNPVVIRNVPW